MADLVSTRPPSGFRDFFGDEAAQRFELQKRIYEVYQQHGFEPLETPVLENLRVLLGSGGQENEKLIFKVLKRGEKLQTSLAGEKLTEEAIADLGLRFDLTVPLGRVVGEYAGQIALPWKVFHIAPVWRAERPQKGRYREFFQCDVDIVGSSDVMAEFEVIQAATRAFESCGLNRLELVLNHRRFIEILAEKEGLSHKLEAFAVVLDKKDKMDRELWLKELSELKGSDLSSEFLSLMSAEKVNEELLETLSASEAQTLMGLKTELEALEGQPLQVKWDLSLVRGMGYYTGSVFEFRLPEADYSLGGGGRYDQLLSRFSKRSLPAVGCSLGFERMLLHLEDRSQSMKNRLFVANFGEEKIQEIRSLCHRLRRQGLSVDLYPEPSKLKTQIKYAVQKSYRWALLAGASEFEKARFSLKNLEQQSVTEVREEEIAPKVLGRNA